MVGSVPLSPPWMYIGGSQVTWACFGLKVRDVDRALNEPLCPIFHSTLILFPDDHSHSTS